MNDKKDAYGTGKILVAEDNLVNQKLLKRFFQQHEIDVLIASNGEEAIDICKNQHIGTILMDCQMPIIDGFEATKIIRKNLGETIRIIAMTAYGTNEDEIRCIEAGMNHFIKKPVDLDVLEDLLGLSNNKIEDTKVLDLSEAKSKEAIIEQEIKHLMERIHFDYDISHELIHVFIDQLKSGIKEIENLIWNRDFKNAYNKSHQLKGAAGAVRIERIRSRIEQMEIAIKEENIEVVEACINEIKADALMIE